MGDSKTTKPQTDAPTARVRLAQLNGGESLWLRLPSEIAAALGWQAFDRVEMTVVEGRIIARKV